jgi:multidrug resistance efflux pump
VHVKEGDTVQAGQVLFRMDDTLLKAQIDQAQQAVSLAKASLESAKAQLESARLQAQSVLQNARAQERQTRLTEWSAPVEDEFDLPNWYYQKDEQIAAAQSAVESARQKLADEQANLEKTLKDASNQDFLAVEKRLAEAQVAYQIAELTLEQAKAASGEERQSLESAAQKELDLAKANLDSAQTDYQRMLSTSAADSVLTARARLAVAHAQWENAQDELDRLLSGEKSLAVQMAQASVQQAEKAVSQAEASLAQAQAALRLLELQLEKTQVKAPTTGTVLSLDLEEGEVVGAGSIVMTLAQLDEVTLTVYIPEDQYGRIQLGQTVSVSVDSFPDEVFQGKVEYISDQAEFTPRNVQTVEGRKSTVYAVKIALPNPEHRLKPGMPADARFQ